MSHSNSHILLFLLTLGGMICSCAKKEPTYHIGISQCSDDEWRHKMNNEIQREALFYDDVKVEIRTARDNNKKQIEDIEYFIAQDIDLLIVSPNEAAVITPIVECAYQKGIPVVVVDRKILSDQYTSFIGANNYSIGKDVGSYIINRLHKKGRILEITGLSGSSPAIERHKGLVEALQQAPNIEIISSIDAGWLQSIAREKMDSVLLKDQNIDLVFAQNDRMAIGAYLAAKEHQVKNDILFVGIDALPGHGYGVEQVMNQILDASFIYPTEGDKVMQLAMNILTNKSYKKENWLSAALVDQTNARVMQLQTDHIVLQDGKIEHLNNQIDDYLSRYSVQTMLLYACLAILVLLATLLAFILRAYLTKSQMNTELSLQKRQLEENRDQLIALSKQLEEATHAKLVFFTNVSHDFRTPLTLIADPIEQLLKQNSTLSPQHHSLIKIIHKNVHILLRLVNQILDFRKYENGKLELSLSWIDLKAQLKEWSSAFQPLAIKKHIHFDVDIQEGDCDYIMAIDLEKVERIYFNLLSNAFKFTPENGLIRVYLSTVITSKQEVIRLEIKDTGSGISAQHVQHIFDRFYQIDINHAGSGIGLALVKTFVELHNGTITVESIEGNGTKFVVEIPIVKHSKSESPVVLPAQITPELIMDELSDIDSEGLYLDENKDCILVIDDNASVRAYIKSLLSEHYTIIEAAEGRSGLKQAMKYIPNAIVCDVMMPIMDGLECCKQLKAELRTSHIPVILLTACSLDEQRINGFDSGADSYISKPFNSQLLLARIRNLISNRNRLKLFFEDQTAPSKDKLSEIDKGFANKFRLLLEEQLSNSELRVEDLGSKMGLGRVQLYRKIKALTNYSPNELLRIARLKKASSLLSTTDKTIAEITYEVGFTSPSYFTKCYKEYFGESPTDFIKRYSVRK